LILVTGCLSAPSVLTTVEREQGLESKRRLMILFSVQVSRLSIREAPLFTKLSGNPHRSCNGSYNKFRTKSPGEIWTAASKSSHRMDYLGYFLSLKQESILIFCSNCLLASFRLAWKSPYSVFQIPCILLGIWAMLRHTFDKRGGTLLRCILPDAGYVGSGRINRSQWIASP
jgi:hypothetical protein